MSITPTPEMTNANPGNISYGLETAGAIASVSVLGLPDPLQPTSWQGSLPTDFALHRAWHPVWRQEISSVVDDAQIMPVSSYATASSSDWDESAFGSGVFTVGETGAVSIDFLFDGGGYEGDLAMFSLTGMESIKPGSKAFIQEAARRSLTNSTLGHIVISDPVEGARFNGGLPHERDLNKGDYTDNKTFAMTPGDRFGFMLVPDGWTQEVFEKPGSGGSKKPLFSMATLDPDDALDGKQFADVTGDGIAFGWEDLKLPKSDRDYNDLIFQVQGATGGAVHIDELINSPKEWRNSKVGQELVQSVVDPLDPAGNTANRAVRSLPSTAGRTYRGWVGSLDPDDFYSFSLGMSNEFNLSLDGLSENANVEVLDFDDNIVFRSTNFGKAAESINGLLEHGAYRVRVFSEGNISTPYNLKLSVKPTIEGITTTGSEAFFDIDIDESSRLINMDDFRSGNPAQGWHPEFLGVDGSGFSTVIIDTGIEEDHDFFGPDLNNDGVADRIIRQHDFVNNDRRAEDNSGHGTNVSSIVASQHPEFTGMTPAVNIIHLKVSDNDVGNLNNSVFGRVEQALQWVVLNAEALNIVSVNMSFSDRFRGISGNYATPQQLFGLHEELNMLNDMGVILVATTSNFFPEHGNTQGVAYPAADPTTIAVGAVWDGGDWWNDNGTRNNIADDFIDTSIADEIALSSQRPAILIMKN